jgi:hypothetical protein
MINFIITLLLLQFIKALITKKRSTIIGCGLLGYSGEYPADKDKLAILFLYNQTRGEDSCGYYNHDIAIAAEHRIEKVSGKVSLNLLPNEIEDPTNLFIGHTRAATSGTGRTSAHNAHPFLFGKWVGVHNGTLTNLKGLITEYDMNEKIIDIDSKIFPASMHQENNFKILNNYDGAAALLWANTDINEKSPLYVYHDKERPLFSGTIKKGSKIGRYISSIKDSLKAIGCTNIESFEVDTLYSIKNGTIEETMAISRNNPIKNNLKRIPDSIQLACRESKSIFTQKGKTTNVFSDGTVIVTVDNYYGIKKCIREEVVYDPKREITVHVRYMSDGGFEEVLVSNYQDKKDIVTEDLEEENTIALEDVMDYMAELYYKLDESRATLSIALDNKVLKEEDVESLDDAMLNVTKFIGSLAEIGETEEIE